MELRVRLLRHARLPGRSGMCPTGATQEGAPWWKGEVSSSHSCFLSLGFLVY